MNRSIISIIAILGGYFLASSAHAGVVIGGTRIIYDATKKDASITVSNPDNHPYLIQTWVDNVENVTKEVPFIVTPPLYRLNAGKKSMMRIVYTESSLPENQESMFYFNVKAIPSSSETSSNVLQVVVKSKMKLIYRPQKLKGIEPESFAENLQWNISGNQLNVKNPSPFYMNFGEIKLNGSAIKSASYVAPNSSANFTLPGPMKNGAISFKLINDYGGLSKEFNSKI